MKLSNVIIVIAFIFIIVGGYLILTNPINNEDVSGDLQKIPLKTQDFNLFEIDIPKGSNFTVKNEASGMKYYQNTGKYANNISGIIINKNLTESLIGDNSVSVSNTTTEQIYSSQFKNGTIYKLVSNQDDVDFIIIGNDLNLLKEVSDTIKVKDSNL
ncbi:hypothetical protein [Methanobrevibacter sp.]|uniref:hypothetical protein n=1 Tax=Methanobrevibacter sp. TaxID=66852 RepID=UPI0025F8D181|nr:hypothetical protein [Methanobrevibacter sp.]MBR4448168.1 hypothetical protein [Methanobrevibacter sp.]